MSCDSFCAEFVEIAGEDAHADRDLLIRREKVTVFRHGCAERCPAEAFPLCDQDLAVYHIFVGAVGRLLQEELILRHPAARHIAVHGGCLRHILVIALSAGKDEHRVRVVRRVLHRLVQAPLQSAADGVSPHLGSEDDHVVDALFLEGKGAESHHEFHNDENKGDGGKKRDHRYFQLHRHPVPESRVKLHHRRRGKKSQRQNDPDRRERSSRTGVDHDHAVINEA